MRPKGIIVFGIIFIVLALLRIYGLIMALHSLPSYVTNVIIFSYSFIFIIGYLYAGIKILNLKYSGVYAAYFMCLLNFLDVIWRIFLNRWEGISIEKLVGGITAFVVVFLLYLLLFIAVIRYFRNSSIREYFKPQEKYLKRILVMFIAASSLIGIMVIWDCYSIRISELQKELELNKLKQAGFPTTVDEIVPPAIPDSENGALVYRAAFKIKGFLEQKYKTEWKFIGNPKEFEKASAEDKKRVSDAILNDPDFSKFYQLLEKASRMKCQFLTKEDYQDGIGMLTPHLFSIKNCSGILATKAKVETESGLIDKALSSCLTSLKMARCLEGQETLISQLVRMAMDIAALNSLNYVIDYGNTSPNLYSSLINQMESERKSKKIQPALKAELVFFIDIFERFGKESSNKPKKITPEKMSVDLPPDLAVTFKKVSKINPKIFWADQTVTYCRVLSEEIPISEKPYFEGVSKFQDLEKKVKKLPASKAIMTQLLTSGLFKAYSQEAKINAYLGVAEIGLANRLYKNKYSKFADLLNQLSPEFLPALPKDPFTGKDFIYRKQGNTLAVYSVGEDLKDDGGQERGIKKDIVWIDKGI